MAQAGRRSPFFVVGIGASAGGLEALIELLGSLPATGMAFIVVQHLDPTHESLLSEILAKKTAIPVSVAVKGEALRSDHVYVIPADAILTVHDGLIDLKRRSSTTERPFPVDVLFSSLAVAYSDGAIGVVLSGGDSDGSLGIREIKHAGGFTFAQRPESARFPTHAQTRHRNGLRGSRVAPERDCRRDRASQPSIPNGGVDAPIRIEEHTRHRHRRRERATGTDLPATSLGARCGFHPLQADHDQAAHRATHDAATDRAVSTSTRR